MEELILLVVVVAVLVWVKNKFIEPETSKKIDGFFSQGLTLLKKLLSQASGNIASPEKPSDIEKADAHPIPAQQSIVEHKQRQVEALENSDVSPTKNINTVDSCQNSRDKIPEDSVLRRHYLTQIAAERESITHPYPTDSVLRRHYENMFALANQSTEVNKPEIATAIVIDTPSEKQQIPEDAALRRHFLTQLQAEVESTLCSRPTDATLKRHYDHLVCASIAERLAEMAS